MGGEAYRETAGREKAAPAAQAQFFVGAAAWPRNVVEESRRGRRSHGVSTDVCGNGRLAVI